MKPLGIDNGNIKEVWEDVDLGTYKIESGGYKSVGSIDFDVINVPGMLIQGANTIVATDSVDHSASSIYIGSGLDVGVYRSGDKEGYATDSLDGTAGLRFYTQNSSVYKEAGATKYSLNAGVVGSLANDTDINASGGALQSLNYGFYSDVFFLGSQTLGGHIARNILFGGIIETEGHTLSEGFVTNAILYGDDDTFLVEAGDETHFILDSSAYPWTKRVDNGKLIMGADDDFEMYWDGSFQIFDPTAGGGIKVKTGATTDFYTSEWEINLGDAGGFFPEDLILKAPYLIGNTWTSLPEIFPVPKVLAISDGVFMIDESDRDEFEIVGLKKDLSDRIGIIMSLTDRSFQFDGHLLPDEESYEYEEYYDLGATGQEWKDLWLRGNANLSDTSAIYLGDSATDGTWRFIRNGNNLEFQRRESGSWVKKGEFTS